MLICGRITGDAKIKKLTDHREVVEFSLAVSHWLRSKRTGEGSNITTFFNCSYWKTGDIVPLLKKATIVELYGRVQAKPYTDASGTLKATLDFHCNSIKIVHPINNTPLQKEE